MMIGFLIGDYGILVWIIKRIPGLEEKVKKFINMVKGSYKPNYRKRVTN